MAYKGKGRLRVRLLGAVVVAVVAVAVATAPVASAAAVPQWTHPHERATPRKRTQDTSTRRDAPPHQDLGATLGTERGNDTALACRILRDGNYSAVLAQARTLLKTFDAGSSYPEVWIRDFATFADVCMDVVAAPRVRELLLRFLSLQAADGGIVDGYREDNNQTFKNTVETDQETSFVQALRTYVGRTGDTGVLDAAVTKAATGQQWTVREAVESAHGGALGFLTTQRWSQAHGLLWGGTTIDWGDVQPEDAPGTVFDNASHPAVDIYDNAMLVMALRDWVNLTNAGPSSQWATLLAQVSDRIESQLWNVTARKYVPHLYLEKGSPFPTAFDEGAMYYHGGTMVAAQAGLLTAAQVAEALATMRANVKASGAAVTIGMTVHPPYPNGYWANGCCNHGYSYQNAGDWSWFGGRFAQVLLRTRGLAAEGAVELDALVDRVVQYGDFNEWYDFNGKPSGSGQFHGAAGVIGRAIKEAQEWAAGVVTGGDVFSYNASRGDGDGGGGGGDGDGDGGGGVVLTAGAAARDAWVARAAAMCAPAA